MLRIERSKVWERKWRVVDAEGATIGDNLSKAGARLVASTPRRVAMIKEGRASELLAEIRKESEDHA